MKMSNVLKNILVVVFFSNTIFLSAQSVIYTEAPNITVEKGNDDHATLEVEDVDVVDMKTLCQRNDIELSKLVVSENNYTFWTKKKNEEGFSSRLYKRLIVEHLIELKNQINQK